MDVALSPCPNDTFLLYPWIAGHVGQELPITPHYLDIQQLNEQALAKRYPLTKLSIPTFGKLRDSYDLLPIGAALGMGQGPKIVARAPYTLSEINSLRIAIPGRETTAHLLFNLFVQNATKKRFCLYHEVLPLLKKGEVDCGVIIHETRFTFVQEGFYEIADLGELFFKKTAAPLPLGGLALRKDYVAQKKLICSILADSLAYARRYPEEGMTFILEKSQEKDRRVVEEHIALYVNQETESLSTAGKSAIDLLLSLEVLNSE